MRTIRLTMTLAAILLVSCTVSKRISFFPELDAPPTGVASSELETYLEKYDGHDAVFLFREEIIEHTGTRSNIGFAYWNFHRTYRDKTIVLNPNNSIFTVFTISMKPDSLVIRVTSPDGNVRIFGIRDLTKEKTNHGTNYTLIYPDIVEGTIIEEAWEISSGVGYFPQLEHNIPLQFVAPCEKLKFRYSYPEWWGIAYKSNANEFTELLNWENDLKAKKTTVSYEGKDIPSLQYEPFSPYYKEMARYLEFHVTNLEMRGGTFERSTSWYDIAEDITEWAFKKTKRAKKGKKVVTELAQQLTGELAGDYDKMEAIVSHVQSNFESTYEHFEGNYGKIIEKKKGSGMDLCSLTSRLMQVVGLKTTIIMVHSARDGQFDPNYFNSGQFDAPAVRVDIDTVSYVVFPYLKWLPVDHTPGVYQGQDAIVLGDGAGSLWKVPPGNRADNTIKASYELDISETGAINIKEGWVVSGYKAYVTRLALVGASDKETREFITDMLTYTDGNVTLDSFVIHQLDNPREPLRIEGNYTIGNLVTLGPDEAIFQTGGLFSPLSNVDFSRDPSDRQNPIQIDYDQQYVKEITIRYSDGWSLATTIEGLDFENEFGSAKCEYTLENSAIYVNQATSLNRMTADKSRAGELAELIGSEAGLNVSAIVFHFEAPDRESGSL